jgi:monofunctional biosynthetic peptidoglycan transglycosylase
MKKRSPAVRRLAAVPAIVFAYLVYVYLTLPDVRSLATSNPSTTAFIDLRAHEAVERGNRPRRIQQWVSSRRISPSLRRAVVITEDAAFWDHDGIDYDELRVSMELNLEERQFVRGASTITQQLAKNLYLSPSRNPIRKVRELIIARRLEAELTKERILELYLNVIEWGDGIYGAEAAARTYFHMSADSLGPEEAALLAGAIVNPRVLSPAQPNARLRARQAIILRRMGSLAATDAPAAAEADAPSLQGQTTPAVDASSPGAQSAAPVAPEQTPDQTSPEEQVHPEGGQPAGTTLP